jgi:long-chain acyl-CoA synthetase
MSAPAAASPQAWGDEVVEELVDGRHSRVYRHRRHSVAELITDLGRWGSRVSLVQGERAISFAELVRHIDVVAAELVSQGLRPGGRVMLLAGNSPEWVAAFWAVFRAGGVAVPGNAWWSASEVGHAVELIEPALVFADERRAALLPPSVRSLRLDEVRGLLDGPPGAARAVDVPVPAEEDPAMILFTSGTMGAAKGVLLSQRSVVSNIHNLLARTNRLPSRLGPAHLGTVGLMCLPLFHIGGIQTLVTGQLSGGRLLFLADRFDPVQVLTLIERERVRFFGGVPTMVARVLDCPRLGEFDTSSLVSVAMGGSVVVPELAERIRRGFPSARGSISSIYGQTEAGGALTSANGTDLLDRPGCVGRPLPVAEIRIAEPDADGVGEVIARSPTLMTGFWAAEAGDSPIDARGWLHTGDLGRLDDEGYLYIVGRSREIIIRGGENIAPGHIENCLLKHPEVADVAVVGLPHPTLGEEVGAAVVVRPGASPTTADLRAHVLGQLARYEVPTRWSIGTSALPLNAAGKVAKRELADNWTDTLSDAPSDTRSTTGTPSTEEAAT